MIGMVDSRIFDTSVLVYAYNESDPDKHKRSLEITTPVFEGREEGIISNQILGELFNVLTSQKKAQHISKEIAEGLVGDFISSSNWTKINYNIETVRAAMMTARTCNIGFWDALIAQTMLENGVTTIITENEKDFKKIPSISVVNPFK